MYLFLEVRDWDDNMVYFLECWDITCGSMLGVLRAVSGAYVNSSVRLAGCLGLILPVLPKGFADLLDVCISVWPSIDCSLVYIPAL